MIEQKIALIGAGQMAAALAGGWIRSKTAAPDRILAADPSPAAREAFEKATGCRAAADNAEVVAAAETIVLAMKPQQFASAAATLRIGPEKLVVSILAGVRLQRLAEAFPQARLIRVMPNTPALVGQAASAYAMGPRAGGADAELVERLFAAVGRITAVDERLLDAVTGLSGSGPAYVYVLIEALSDGGVRMGLPRSTALALAAQTVLGAAEMVLRTNEHPAVLKDRVASPGGTTIAGLAALEEAGFRSALIAAVEAATRRSEELG